MLSNWFLYSKKNNYIITEWKNKIIEYWKKNKKTKKYFIHHYLFKKIYNEDNKFKKIWDSTPKISAIDPHYLKMKGLLSNIKPEIKNHIKLKKTPIYKLIYKFKQHKYPKGTVLDYLLNFKIFFIGFNKTGTNFIHQKFLNNNYKSLHNGRWIGDWIKNNEIKKREKWLDEHQVFSDSELHDFKYLDKEYVNPFFILQTRELDEWINSRLLWIEYHYHLQPNHPFNQCIKTEKVELIKEFVCKRNFYYKNVFSYFLEDKEPELDQIYSNFLFTNITKSTFFQKIFNFPITKYVKYNSGNENYYKIIYEVFEKLDIDEKNYSSTGIVKTNLKQNVKNYYENIKRYWY